MIEFQKIKDAGSLDQERVVFHVNEAGDIGRCMVHCVQSRIKNDSRTATNTLYGSYWFLDVDVEVGDLVVVYTKRSKPDYKVKDNTNGSNKTHFFYWGNDNTLWDRLNVAVVFGRFIDWNMHFVDADGADDVEP